MKNVFLTAMVLAFASTAGANVVESRKLFVQKYEATFGESPSHEMWNLAKAECRDKCKSCSGCKKST